MNQPSILKKIGATPAKLAVVGGLGVVLLSVVVPQLRGKSLEVPVTSPGPSEQIVDLQRPEQQAEKPNKLSTAEGEEVRPAPVWTQLPFEQIVNYDPLAAPAWYVAAVTQAEADLEIVDHEKNSRALEELEQKGASIVVITNQNRVATIGNLQINIGDRIEGFRVSDITTKGVVLTEIHSN